MGVDVPVLHALDPVNATVPVVERLVYVAPLVVVVLHVWVHLASDIRYRPCENPLNDIRTDVVQIVLVVVNRAREVVHMHDLGPRLRAPVLVEQGMQGGGPGHWDYCLQILASHRGCLPLGCAFVGLAVQAHVPIAPVLRAQPLDRSVYSEALPRTPVVEAPTTLLGAEYRYLSEGVTMRYEVLENELPPRRANDIGRRGLRSLCPV